MKTAQGLPIVVVATATLFVAGLGLVSQGNDPRPGRPQGTGGATADERGEPAETEGATAAEVPKPREISEFVTRGLTWLAEAQHKDGGWGAGSHAHQEIRDPHAIVTDPATTAFVATALLRAGHTPTAGKYKDIVRRATEYLCTAVESSPAESPKVTELTGTQPQTKLGPLVDTSMTAQYLARVLTKLDKSDKLHARVGKALATCIKKVELSQQQDGSWNTGGGWAPVLQSSLACQSYELAQAVGCPVDESRLEKARDYQKGNFDTATGTVRAEAGAGVALYALSSSQRANAGEAKAATDAVDQAKREGKLAADAPVNVENLVTSGVARPQAQKFAAANAALQAQNDAVNDDNVLAGFGNNGGEEFLSYLFTSESMVIQGGEPWTNWNEKMHTRLAKVQNPDGSWSGHHCITSPVFCTAAVVQCLTTDREAELLTLIAKNAAKRAGDDKPAEVATP
ncbi:MAG: prenyltransferase/squalene oxidase repeat-containing protein [Planctomycetaceae bacterium]